MTDTPTERVAESTWTRLRRRKVVQWGIAYIAGAWGLLQGLAYVTDIFHWSEYIPQRATLALLIGLPIALVVAWYHGDRGEGRVKGTEIAIITMLFLAGGGIFWLYDRARETTSAPPAPTAVATATDHSIAVLPFVNMSSDPEQEYFSDGLSEELLNMLAKLPELRVIGRTSSFQFKGKNEDLRVIGEKLGAAHLLEGSVRKAGNKVRITAQLVRADDGSHLWSETYDRTLEDIFAVQDDIAGQVVRALEVTLLGGDNLTPRQPQDAEAYNLYLQGRYFYLRQTPEDAERAISYLQRSVNRNPLNATAWVELANVYMMQADYGWRPSAESYGRAREAVEKALALDSNLAGAHSARGWMQSAHLDWAGADASNQKALARDPRNPEVLLRTGWLAAVQGRQEEGLSLIQKALALDPLRLDSLDYLSYLLVSLDRFEEAEAIARKIFELDPNRSSGRFGIGLPLLLQGRTDEARREMEAETTESWRNFGLSFVYYSLGRQAEADASLAALKDHANEMAYRIAEVHAWRGENDLAFEWLDRAYVQQESVLTDIKLSQFIRKLSGDSRYRALLKKLKLPE